jgi:hypothetical protein
MRYNHCIEIEIYLYIYRSIHHLYLSVFLLDAVSLSIEDVDRPLVVVLQWRAHHQLAPAVPVHVGDGGEGGA